MEIDIVKKVCQIIHDNIKVESHNETTRINFSKNEEFYVEIIFNYLKNFIPPKRDMTRKKY